MQNKIIIYLDNKEEPIGEFMSADITLENKEKIKEEILSILSEKLGVSIESITIEPAAMYNGSNRVIIKTIECNDKQSFKYTYKFKIYKSSPARVPTNKTKEKL